MGLDDDEDGHWSWRVAKRLRKGPRGQYRIKDDDKISQIDVTQLTIGRNDDWLIDSECVDTHGLDELNMSNWTWINTDAMTVILAAYLDGLNRDNKQGY